MENIAFAYLLFGWFISAIAMIHRAENKTDGTKVRSRVIYFVALGSNLLATYILWKQ